MIARCGYTELFVCNGFHTDGTLLFTENVIVVMNLAKTFVVHKHTRFVLARFIVACETIACLSVPLHCTKL